MKNKSRLLFITFSIIFILSVFLVLKNPSLSAADCAGYLTSGGGVDSICYNDFASAKANAESRTSNTTTTPVVSKNNKIVYAKHGIVKFKYQNATFNLYVTSNLNATAYTYIHPAYGSEAAFIDYDPTYNAVKLKVSGFVGWTSLDNLSIVPLSSFYGNNVTVISSGCNNIRNNSSLSGTVIGQICQGDTVSYSEKVVSGGYTWYKVSYGNINGWVADNGTWLKENSTASIKSFYEHWGPTGNLIHYYGYYTSTGLETNTYTNLGPAPSYLTKKNSDNDVANNYYSFDGNYFYKSLFDMLSDYKENTYRRSVNSTTPMFPYYLYLPNHSKTGYTAADFDKIITDRGYTSYAQSRMYGQGQYFIESQDIYGVNALLTFSAAINESATGTSAIAMDKNNLFGHGAYDSCAYACATTYPTVRDGILAHARMTGEGFNDPQDWRYFGSHYGNKGSGMGVKYASDPYWGEKAANNAYNQDKKYGMQDYQSNTIGVKLAVNDVNIYKGPSTTSGVIYTIRNNSFSVANVPLVVFDKVTINGKDWYKVYTDVALDDNQNIIDSHYSFAKSYGYVSADSLYVANTQPVINNAKDISVEFGTTFNPATGITASDKEDGNIPFTYTGTVNTNISGVYQITYHAVDSGKFEIHKTINVTVGQSKEPTITATDKTVPSLKTFDPKLNVTAKDALGNDISSRIVVTANNVNVDQLGEYNVTFQVTDANNKTTTKTIKVTVTQNEKPVINVADKQITVNTNFDPLLSVTATDKEDGNITSRLTITENTVNTTSAGTYYITYSVKDLDNQETTKKIRVDVLAKVWQLKSGNFYFEYLKGDNQDLKIKGYLTINGINNVLAENIKYKIEFYNNRTNELVYTFDLNRITNAAEFTRPAIGDGNFVYTYAWFEGNIPLNLMNQGNYIAYITATGNDYYSKAMVSNQLYKSQVASYSGAKQVITRNNYGVSGMPVEFIIRNELLQTKTADFLFNQFGEYRKLQFTNNQLYIYGNSYSYGSNMGINNNVERKLIFENQETYQKYSYDLGSITNGLYDVSLPTKDNLAKNRAWYEKQIDISNIPVGKYTIYVSNKTNVSDIGELRNLFYDDLTVKNMTIGNKKYQLFTNTKLRSIVELIVTSN